MIIVSAYLANEETEDLFDTDASSKTLVSVPVTSESLQSSNLDP